MKHYFTKMQAGIKCLMLPLLITAGYQELIAQNCNTSADFPSTYPAAIGAITVSTSYTGGATTFNPAGQPTGCGFASYPSTYPWTGNATTSSSVTFTFSETVNSINLASLAFGVSGTTNETITDQVVITTNSGTPALAFVSGFCSGGTISGNSYSATFADMNAVLTVTSATPYTSITITQPDNKYSNGGSAFMVCKSSVVPCTTPTVTNPVSAAVCSGTGTSFTATAGGTGPFTYQWLYNGNALTADHSDVNGTYTGSKDATLNITPAGSFFDGGLFSLRVTSSCGIATSTAATLTVTSPPTISVQPSNATACINSPISFTTNTSGTSFQWQFSTNGITWNDAMDGSSAAGTFAGMTTQTATVTPANTSGNGSQWRLVTSNGTCPATSNAVTLTVNVCTAPCAPAAGTITFN
jgi:hypothetical protein